MNRLYGLDRRQLLRAGAGLAGGTLLACVPGSVARPKSSTATAPETAARWNADRRFAETPAGRIAYVERGSGPPALFLHGFPLNGFQWRDIIARLQSSRRCLAPDLLGLGFTEIGPDWVRSILLTNCDVETDCPPAAVLPVIEMAKAGTYVERWLAPWLADGALARSRDGLGGMTFSDPAHPTDEALEMYLGPLVRSARGQAQVNAYAIALEANALAGAEPLLRHIRSPRASSGERPTPSSRSRIPSTSIGCCPGREGSGTCPEPVSSSRRSSPTSSPRRRDDSGPPGE